MKFIFPFILSMFWFKNYNFFLKLFNLFLIMFLLKFSYTNFLLSLNSYFFMDKISMIMIILSFISSIMILISSDFYKKISFLILMIFIFLIFSFSFKNMMLFYISFEIILIPTLILITKFGNQPERLQAGMYMIMYTILASLPLLIAIFNLKNNNFLLSFMMNNNINFPLIFLLAFFIKLPMFFFHLWLPKAHVEAPVEGSMILAAILLKLGGYGIFRFIIIMINKINKINIWIMSLSMIGATATSLNCIRQKDLKSLIAYSSVAHMSFILSSMMTLNMSGMYGALIMLIGHGFSSSALFLMVNMIYSKYHSRNIISFKGLMNMYPNIMFWWYIFMAINMSAPPSINMISEIFMMSSLINFNFSMIFFIFIMSLATTSFCIFMFVNIAHNMNEMLPNNQSYSKLFLSLFMHCIPMIFLIMKLEIMLF